MQSSKPPRFVILSDVADPLAPASDCDCACPVPSLAARPAPDPLVHLQVHPQLQDVALAPGYQMVFAPSYSRVAVVNQAAWELLQRFRRPQTPVDPPADERAAVQRLLQLGLLTASDRLFAPPPPSDELIAWLHVTNDCNLRCTYCYIEHSAAAMSAATGFAALEAIMSAAQRYGYRRVGLKYAGGEASLNLPLVATLHRAAQAQAEAAGMALQGTLLSNGVGLTRSKLQSIADLGLGLLLSLDGPPEVHDAQRPRLGGGGSFRAAAAAIERARAMGLVVTVSITVTGASVAGLPALVGWLLEREVHFMINFYRECDPAARYAELRLDEERLIAGMLAAYAVIEAHLPRYSLLGCLLDRTNLSVAHSRTCATGENYLVIEHNGGVAKCQMEINRPIATVWDADPLGAIRLDPVGVQNVLVDQKEGCRDCTWKYWCAGGCAVATFRATGRYDIQSPNCGVYKALYPAVLRLEGLRLLRQATH